MLQVMVFLPVDPELSPVTLRWGCSKASSQSKEGDASSSLLSLFSEWTPPLVSVAADQTRRAAVGSHTGIGCAGPVQPPEPCCWGYITLCLSPSWPKPLQEYAIALEMCLLTNWPHSLLWGKPNRLFGQLPAHFYGSLLHLCEIWQRFLCLQLSNTCMCSLSTVYIESIDIKSPFWIYSASLSFLDLSVSFPEQRLF